MSQAGEFEPIHELAAQIQQLVRQAIPLYAQEVDAILRSRCTDPQHVEHQLDGMLDFCFDADMLLLFKKLCRYYFRLDPATTADYVRTYREMWEEEQTDSDMDRGVVLNQAAQSGKETQKLPKLKKRRKPKGGSKGGVP